jgi:transcriptional regulator with XRE-family HTH domain
MTELVIEHKRFPLGERIRKARGVAGMSTTKLASALGVDPRTVARWQSNDSRPSYERLVDLARVLEQPPSYFVDEDAA